MKVAYFSLIVIACVAFCVALLFFIPMMCNPKQPTGPTAEPIPEVNPLTADLERANGIIDTMVSLNNLLIRELEECEDGRTIEGD